MTLSPAEESVLASVRLLGSVTLSLLLLPLARLESFSSGAGDGLFAQTQGRLDRLLGGVLLVNAVRYRCIRLVFV